MKCGKNDWPAVVFTFCATFKRAIHRPKITSDYFFLSNLFINGQAFIISGEKNTNFFSIVQGSAREKTYKIIINPRFYFTDTQKQLWNCCNIYESAVSITSPLKDIKMVKTDPKKVPSQVFFLLVPLGTIAQLFTKQNSYFTIPIITKAFNNL